MGWEDPEASFEELFKSGPFRRWQRSVAASNKLISEEGCDQGRDRLRISRRMTVLETSKKLEIVLVKNWFCVICQAVHICYKFFEIFASLVLTLNLIGIYYIFFWWWCNIKVNIGNYIFMQYLWDEEYHFSFYMHHGRCSWRKWICIQNSCKIEIIVFLLLIAKSSRGINSRVFACTPTKLNISVVFFYLAHKRDLLKTLISNHFSKCI